jgi:hypothetical protein
VIATSTRLEHLLPACFAASLSYFPALLNNLMSVGPSNQAVAAPIPPLAPVIRRLSFHPSFPFKTESYASTPILGSGNLQYTFISASWSGILAGVESTLLFSLTSRILSSLPSTAHLLERQVYGKDHSEGSRKLLNTVVIGEEPYSSTLALPVLYRYSEAGQKENLILR